MHRFPLLLLSLLVGLALMAAACGADTSTDVGDGTDDTSGAGEETDGTSPDGAWVLVDSMVDGTPLAVLDGYAVTMNIDSGDLGGRAACNSYGGTVVLTDTDFSSSDLFQTEMGCEEPAMSLEFAYLSSLGRVVSWARTGDALTLAGDGVSLTFELVPPPPTADLVDTAWILDTIIEGEAASSTISGAADARLLFEADGTFTGSTGCRTFAGSYVETGGTITITSLTMEGDCDADFVGQDNAVVSVIEGEVTIEIDGPHLTLTSPFNEGLRYTAE